MCGFGKFIREQTSNRKAGGLLETNVGNVREKGESMVDSRVLACGVNYCNVNLYYNFRAERF